MLAQARHVSASASRSPSGCCVFGLLLLFLYCFRSLLSCARLCLSGKWPQPATCTQGRHAAGFCMPPAPARGNSNGLRHKRSCFRDRKVWAARRNRPFASSLSTSPLVQSARGIERSAGLANKNRAGLARARPTKACRATWAVGPPAEARPGPSNVPC